MNSILYNFSSGSNFSKAHFTVVIKTKTMIMTALDCWRHLPSLLFACWVILPQPHQTPQKMYFMC